MAPDLTLVLEFSVTHTSNIESEISDRLILGQDHKHDIIATNDGHAT